jgi:hypothetical protein
MWMWLGSRPPRTYAVAYIAAIPCFATLYWSFPKASFYAPYATLEQVASEDIKQAGNIIDKAFHRSLRARLNVLGSDKLHLTGFTLRKGNEFVFDIGVDAPVSDLIDTFYAVEFYIPEVQKKLVTDWPINDKGNLRDDIIMYPMYWRFKEGRNTKVKTSDVELILNGLYSYSDTVRALGRGLIST